MDLVQDFVEPCEEGRAAGEEADAVYGALKRAEGVVLRVRLVAAQAYRRLVEAIAVFGHQAARPCGLVGHDLRNQIHFLLDEGKPPIVRGYVLKVEHRVVVFEPVLPLAHVGTLYCNPRISRDERITSKYALPRTTGSSLPS